MVEQIIVMATLALALLLFIQNRYRYDLVALFALMIVVVTEIVPAEEAFSGFGHPAVITVAAVLIISRGLSDAGLVHMVGRNRLDKIWLGIGPGYKLLTICNCCPCCCLYGTLPYMSPRIGRKIQKLPGAEIRVSDLCIGCGTCCEGICFVDAIQIINGTASIRDDCRACGRCVEVCPEGAIELSIESGQVFNQTIDRLSGLVDLT